MTKKLAFALSIILISSYAYGEELIKLSSQVHCPTGEKLQVDGKGTKDICLSSNGVASIAKCSQMSRSNIASVVSRSFSKFNLSGYRLNNVIEFLHHRSFRMDLKHWSGRDLCYLQYSRSQLQLMASE